ncbi:AAA family ATPase [Celeribacter sp.]|uniref:AAA family ATPase n=1 Tax=Celeribacter sp. TaxID=1890673 RepID=UPI003A92F8ED
MQILTIRGQNIASLAKPFEIRLDRDPLRSAGLFAITGETGAGKSSLLDAMCLALYANCPRLSGDGTRETVADIDGHALRSNDPRMALRRGAAMGYAEVTFQANDGAIYTAAWQARRAREKIDGRLQSVDRSLLRVADNQVIETQSSRVNDKIVELTGLTYDEFRRTVLLAQGDFDAFLGAKTDERAAILEKVTGTGIYRDISRRIFERHREVNSALKTLETRRGEHQLLTPEARETLTSSITDLRAAQTKAATELAAMQADLDRYKTIETAKHHLTAATLRVTQAKENLDALAEDQNWLTEWEGAQELRSEVRALTEANSAVEEAEVESRRLTTERTAHQESATDAQNRLNRAKEDRDKAEAAFKTFGPDWDRAARLDSQIMTAADEHKRALTSLDQSKAQKEVCLKERDGLVAQVATLTQTIDDLTRQRDATLGHDTLLSDWTMIEDRLERRIAQLVLATDSATEATRLTATIASDTETRAKRRAEIDAATDAIKAARTVQDAIKGERDQLNASDPSAQLNRLGQALIGLRALRQIARDMREADTALATSQKKREAAEARLSNLKQTAERARERQKQAEHRIAALRSPVQSAEAAVSQEAAHLRQHLVEGEPCPVCQSTAHPVMKNAALAHLAKELRDQLETAQTAFDQARNDVAKATNKIAVEADIIDAETAKASALTAQIVELETTFTSPRNDLIKNNFTKVISDDPRVDDTQFDAIGEQLSTLRRQLEADQERLETLNRDYQNAAETIEQRTAQIATWEEHIRTIDSAIETTQKTISALEQKAQTARDTVAAIDLRLAPVLAPTELRAEMFDAQAAPRLEALRETVFTLRSTQQKIDEANAKRAEIDAARATSEAALKSATRSRAQAETVEKERADALHELRDQRQKLLGGEDTNTHRTRHNNWRTAAHNEVDAAQANASEKTATLAALTSALKAAQAAKASATQKAQDAKTALSEACTAAKLHLDRVLELHGAEAQKVQSIRAAIKAAQAEYTAAEGAQKERATEYEALIAKGVPAQSKDTLTTTKAEIEAKVGERGETLGRLSQQLEADAQAAKTLSGLEAEIDAARKTAETWAAVNDAVGAAKGDKFAQIAQAVTLALLVERANLHLDDLKPRYQLRVASSDLALHIIDRDMAGDARPTRLLSGGERFLVSLALALALSGMGNRGMMAGTLFIDEGFGSLDADSLDLAIDALERLQAQGRTIGVISHVQAMKDRIPVQLQVTKTGGGASEVTLALR